MDEYVVEAADVGTEWVRVAARVFPGLLTVSKAKRERKKGVLRLNAERLAATNTRVALGDRIQFHGCTGMHSQQHLQSHEDNAGIEMQGLRRVYEGDAIAVIVKPTGVHVNGRGVRTVENALPMLLLASSSHSGAGVLSTPHAVHRLDARVGGLLLIAKTRCAESHLSAQFENHSVRKQYRAILIGYVDTKALVRQQRLHFAPSHRVGDDPLMISDSDVLYCSEPVAGKPCSTALRVVSYSKSGRYEWLTTVDLWPLTGRKHQLRMHMAHIGHPIVGDDLYHNGSGAIGVASAHDDDGESVGTDADLLDGAEAGLFLYAIAIAFLDTDGNKRSFAIDEPHKFARFRHFCAYNSEKKKARGKEEKTGKI
uniref:Pseudouridine synthase RsuA/RluA-like domain-containing protein n=1 Tax=Globisporangium ultimum (strain ATCC 200006 / CBS 805.95 / DAOM BR144) TaxID=431595 RepID=K3W4Y6_GLOUD